MKDFWEAKTQLLYLPVFLEGGGRNDTRLEKHVVYLYFLAAGYIQN